jgi:membrane protein
MIGLPGLRGLKPIALFTRTVKLFLDNDMLTYASALAFQSLFSIFPFIVVMVSVLGLVDMMEFFDWLRSQAATLLPEEAMTPLDRVLEEVQQPRGGLFSIGLIVALWVASGAMRSTINAMNVIYKVKEGRPFWKLYPLSIVYTIAVAGMLVSAAMLMVFGPQTMEWLADLIGFQMIFVTLWTWIRIPLALALMMATVAFVYFVAPDVEQRLRFITPGSMLAVIVWIAASAGFRYYIQTFADYSAVYGSIGTVIVLMMYFFISSAVLLFGAELNAVIEDHAPAGKNLGEKKYTSEQSQADSRRKPASGQRHRSDV